MAEWIDVTSRLTTPLYGRMTFECPSDDAWDNGFGPMDASPPEFGTVLTLDDGRWRLGEDDELDLLCGDDMCSAGPLALPVALAFDDPLVDVLNVRLTFELTPAMRAALFPLGTADYITHPFALIAADADAGDWFQTGPIGLLTDHWGDYELANASGPQVIQLVTPFPAPRTLSWMSFMATGYGVTECSLHGVFSGRHAATSTTGFWLSPIMLEALMDAPAGPFWTDFRQAREVV